jgi:hypothetical protein
MQDEKKPPQVIEIPEEEMDEFLARHAGAVHDDIAELDRQAMEAVAAAPLITVTNAPRLKP